MRGSQTNFIKLLSNKRKYKLKVEFLKKKKKKKWKKKKKVLLFCESIPYLKNNQPQTS